MKPSRVWTAAAPGSAPYVLDLVGTPNAPSSVVGLLSNAKAMVIQSVESNAFSSVSLTTGTNAKQVSALCCSTSSSGDPQFSSLFWSCSSEGVIAAWDMFRDPSRPAFVSPGKLPCFSSIACGMGGTVLACGSEEGVDSKILFFDVRNMSQPLGAFSETHSDSITNLVFHPNGGPIMLSGSIDGLVCAFDLTKPSETAALQSVMNANSVCSRIGFFGANHEGVYATTRTETLSLFELESSETVTAFEYDLAKGTGCRETLQGIAGIEINYLVDCMWEPKTQKLLLIAGNSDGRGFGFEVGLGQFHALGPINGCHKDVIRSSKLFELEREGLAIMTGGEDGKMCLWTV